VNNKIFFSILLMMLLAACASGQASVQINTIATEVPLSIQPTRESNIKVVSLPAVTLITKQNSSTATNWKNLPVIPALSSEMLDVYFAGQQLGHDTHVVSVVGDCESSSDWFLKDFSKGARFYNLGSYSGLQETIDYFNPSLGYKSYAAVRGATASTMLTPLWADHQACSKNESPLGCEYRLHNPAFAFIALGTNDVHKLDQFEPMMRAIIEYTLKQNIVPILVTKADNVEGDESINLAIAQLAIEYNLPIWNFWAAVQSLPSHGLQEDGEHLTFGSNYFDNPETLQHAWPLRNLTALQVLEAMRLAVQEK